MALVIEHLAAYAAPVIFVGALVFGETVIIPAAALAAHGHWTVPAVVGWAFAGTVTADALWFAAAHGAFGRVASRFPPGGAHPEALAWLDRRAGHRPARLLLFVKFVYGTRILSIAYLASRDVRAREFVLFDAVGTAVWLAVIVPVGWFVGRGVAGAASGLATVERTIAVAVALTLVIKGLSAWLSRRARDR